MVGCCYLPLLEPQRSADTEWVRRQDEERTAKSSDDKIFSQRPCTHPANCLIIDNINTNVNEHMAKDVRVIWSMKKYICDYYTFCLIHDPKWTDVHMIADKKEENLSKERISHLSSSVVEIAVISAHFFILALESQIPSQARVPAFDSAVTPCT